MGDMSDEEEDPWHDRDLSFPYPGTREHKGRKDGGSKREGS